MKKLFTGVILLSLIFISTACTDDRSFSIDEVTIDAQIQKDGSMHVRELFTYTFNGSYEGMTRSIESDVKNFNAYLTDGKDPSVSTENLDSLEAEEEDDTYQIFSDSTNETKSVLYSYDVEGSVKKYSDVADLKYAFFDDSNETDLNDVTITLRPPEGTGAENQHFFLHEDNTGKLSASENGVQYKSSLLEAGSNSQIRFVFPSDQLTGMEANRDNNMEDTILAEEQELAERAESLALNMSRITPVVLILLGLLAIGSLFMFIFHPNRYRGSNDIDSLQRLVEKTDPLFVKYLNNDGRFPDDSFIAGLFSLKQRGIVTLEKVPSSITDGKETYRFNRICHQAGVDEADVYLLDWLFTEKDDKGAYFLLESLIAQDDESDEAKEEKADHFKNHFDKWTEKVENRNNYQGLKKSFKGFPLFSIPLLIASFGLFYYFTTIDTISRTEQWVLPLIAGGITAVGLLFNRNKWVLLGYYFVMLLMTAIGFSFEPAVIMTLIFYGLSVTALLVIPEFYWTKDIRQLKYAIKQAYRTFKGSHYPVGEDPTAIEERLEYAIILGAGEEYGEQCKSSIQLPATEVYYPLLKNPIFATTSFSASNIALYTTAIHVNSTNTTTSSTGGGGAGAF
ncbi:DUF2207 domain-containing protein [Lentibacillus sp. CBA3610]|uniref:DUF2207 domain-containing protein n=1 Tax=Lentibacillus sp. CBA3610 TaxID=2518176 RepID=UPI0015950A5B|nr:DUF2207 domain-containing protein [Lentibacillus sp. CBA3610]QKY69017.1 DUF2207 domain-containing protein [Lentibacillus sp. CBA3610]